MLDLINCLTDVVLAGRLRANYKYELSIAQQSWGSPHSGRPHGRPHSGQSGKRHVYKSYNQSKDWRRYHGKSIRQAAKKAGRCRV